MYPTLPFIYLLKIPFIAPKRACKQTFILNNVIYLISVLLIVSPKVMKKIKTKIKMPKDQEKTVKWMINKSMMDYAAVLWAFFTGGYGFLGCSSGIAFPGS